MYDFDVEISAINKNLKAEHQKWIANGFDVFSMSPSSRQRHGFIGLLRLGLQNSDREMRIGVLQLLAGEAVKDCVGITPINTSKNLSTPMVSFLISILREPESKPWRLSEYGKWLLSTAETRTQILLGQLQIPSLSNL